MPDASSPLKFPSNRRCESPEATTSSAHSRRPPQPATEASLSPTRSSGHAKVFETEGTPELRTPEKGAYGQNILRVVGNMLQQDVTRTPVPGASASKTAGRRTKSASSPTRPRSAALPVRSLHSASPVRASPLRATPRQTQTGEGRASRLVTTKASEDRAYRPSDEFFFFTTSRSMPTANADGLGRPEGT